MRICCIKRGLLYTSILFFVTKCMLSDGVFDGINCMLQESPNPKDTVSYNIHFVGSDRQTDG